MKHLVVPDLGLHCLLRPVCPSSDRIETSMFCYIHSYNLSETIESIKTSLSYQPVQNVMTREMEEEYDRKLIESFKQQSSLDMVRLYRAADKNIQKHHALSHTKQKMCLLVMHGQRRPRSDYSSERSNASIDWIL